VLYPAELRAHKQRFEAILPKNLAFSGGSNLPLESKNYNSQPALKQRLIQSSFIEHANKI
jgi:hypothetical protein